MNSVWKVYAKKADFNEIGKKYGIDPVIARIIRNRDVEGWENLERYINGSRKDLYDGFLMKDMEKGVKIIAGKIRRKTKIRIIGDYDVDGVSSIFILLKGLKRLNADVDYVIPHRIMDGYGINEKLIQDAADSGVDTIITCDNGIAAIEQIAFAKSLNMTVVITDHHDIRFKETDGEKQYIIPQADAVINPKQKDCGYPFKELCGAAVAYKFIECLCRDMQENDREFMDSLLEMAAVATVGDVMDLQGENRIIVKEGLKLLNHTKNLGLRSLMELNGISPGNLSAYHIGFIIGPCLNASGRLDTARRSLELLMADNKADADRLAGDLKAFNEERKNLTLEQTEIASEMVETTKLSKDNVLVVYLPDCHESIAGIIAGRLRERYYKPVFVITDSEEGLKGSGRSIEGYHMFEKLLMVSDLMTKFGGHPMAAGVSLPKENLEEFRRRLNEDANLTEKELTPVEWIDVAMPVDYITEELIGQLNILEPFGKGNEKPSFADRNLMVSRVNIIGKNRNVLKLQLTNERGNTIEALKFNADENMLREVKTGDLLSVIYYPSVNEFNGKKTLQIVIHEMRVQK
ncbi:MAG: single-stranded-DNA-specific exonuclease RecJ [Thermoflexaceae bacterium]|nr:single-stranded-DNA-specific exonuclease RecJ [Thermoflexaceae bacterium]